MHPRLAEVMDYISNSRADLFTAVAGLPEEVASRRPASGSWSIAEILDHLRKVEKGTLLLAHRLLWQAKSSGLGPETSTESVLSSLDTLQIAVPRIRVNAPERVMPDFNVPAEQSLQHLRQSREELQALLQSVDGLALGALTFEHPFAGVLNLYQWILILGQHEERHTRQIKDTLNSLSMRSRDVRPQ
jgi:uncharacterized damage-inducible protein DinB